jgi:drug/metabolite transporter (DMT)-like permease
MKRKTIFLLIYGITLNRMKSSAIVVLSEIALALYPILIKRVPTDLTTQTLSRLLTFSILGFALGSSTDVSQTWMTSDGLFRSLGLGLITLLHVGVSYFAFEALPAGVAMSLFYFYPIFNLIGGVLGFGESISALQMVLVFVAFLGVILVSLSITEGATETETETETETQEKPGKDPKNLKGILAGLAAALTETLMYFGVRTAKLPNPYFATLELYPGALIPFVGMLLASGAKIDWRPSVWLPMTLFNTFIGFIGYALRFYAVPRVSTLLFSLLAFIGVIASFVWGYLFAEETPSWMALLGALLISLGVGFSDKQS